jgi:hypothetical protein
LEFRKLFLRQPRRIFGITDFRVRTAALGEVEGVPGVPV